MAQASPSSRPCHESERQWTASMSRPSDMLDVLEGDDAGQRLELIEMDDLGAG